MHSTTFPILIYGECHLYCDHKYRKVVQHKCQSNYGCNHSFKLNNCSNSIIKDNLAEEDILIIAGNLIVKDILIGDNPIAKDILVEDNLIADIDLVTYYRLKLYINNLIIN